VDTCEDKGSSDFVCLDEALTVLQVSPGTYAASKTQCSDCKGVGERLKEKERYVKFKNLDIHGSGRRQV